jgi:NADH:ubiquinone oxidoreductase subunit 6 (subunit J)
MELLAFAAILTLILASAIAAVLLENLLHAAIALGVGSAMLAVALFLLDAPYAGSFELSVGAGLISVLFVVAITLTESVGSSRRER